MNRNFCKCQCLNRLLVQKTHSFLYPHFKIFSALNYTTCFHLCGNHQELNVSHFVNCRSSLSIVPVFYTRSHLYAIVAHSDVSFILLCVSACGPVYALVYPVVLGRYFICVVCHNSHNKVGRNSFSKYTLNAFNNLY
jgi:hypothetical protein